MRNLRYVMLMAISQSCAAFHLLGYNLSPDHPNDSARTSVVMKGLQAEVSVVFDAQGVPHVEAQNLVDLARASGFVQGRARFFQMDLMRRLARGRVSELVGDQPLLSSTTVAYDEVMRAWQIEARATAGLAELHGEDLAHLKAFADGVNAALQKQTPLEYRLLQVTPEPWTPEDTLAVGLLNVWSITHNYQQEATRLLLALSVGLERMEKIYPSEPLSGARTIETFDNTRVLPPSVVSEVRPLFSRPSNLATPGLLTGRETIDVLTVSGASNAWAIDGAHSQSGKPMLANDPHLSHLLPGILMQIHLKSPQVNVIGVTVPGLPWVIAGHNERVGFATTSSMSDAVDLVIEKPLQNPTDEIPGLVAHEEGECFFRSRQETVRVRHHGALVDRVFRLRETCNGPLYNDMHPELFPAGAPLVAIRWKTAQVETSIGGLLELNRARSVQEVGQVVSRLSSTWNTWTSADVEGSVGAFVSGEVPLRPNHRGTFPVPGWLKIYEWNEFGKGDQLPSVMNPKNGIIAHANNLMADPRSEKYVPMQTDSAPPYRVQRIVDLATATAKHRPQSFKSMLTDVYSIRAERLVPSMLRALSRTPLSPLAQNARDLLARWDFRFEAAKPEGAIFFSSYREAVQRALVDELSPAALQFFLAQRYSTNTCDSWFDDAQHVVWDDLRTPQTEDLESVFIASFERAMATLQSEQGPRVERWTWGALHQHQPKHAFGNQSLLAPTVNLEPKGASGELDTIWKSHFDLGNAKAPFKVVAGPAWRMVVDFADASHAWWVVDSGASGWPKSPHYGDQYKVWSAGELVPMLTNFDELRGQAHGELRLVP
jgi:penicillin G amidase